MKHKIKIDSEDLAWLKQELGYQRSSDQSRLKYAGEKWRDQIKQNIERQSRILDALTEKSV